MVAMAATIQRPYVEGAKMPADADHPCIRVAATLCDAVVGLSGAVHDLQWYFRRRDIARPATVAAPGPISRGERRLDRAGGIDDRSEPPSAREGRRGGWYNDQGAIDGR